MGTALVKAPRIDPDMTCFRIEIRPSKIHRYGVYALQRIPANRKVIEYAGERINRLQASKRAEGDYTYLFAVDSYWTLDGAVGGSGAEIINHCCEPNLISRVMKSHILRNSPSTTISEGERNKFAASAAPQTAGVRSRNWAAQPRSVREVLVTLLNARVSQHLWLQDGLAVPSTS